MNLRYYLRLVNLARTIPGFRSVVWHSRQFFHAMERRLLVQRPVVEGNRILYDVTSQRIPTAAGKMGSTEAKGLHTYLRRRKASLAGGPLPNYTEYNYHTLFINCGVFPQTPDTFDRFFEEYLHAVEQCSVLAAWNVAGEAQVLRRFCRGATLIQLRGLEPYFHKTPWSGALKGRKVLVITPFTGSVEKQYSIRGKIWPYGRVLPQFELSTIRAPLSAGLVKPSAGDWFEALNDLKDRMNDVEYDVALIGAGAFSLPLAVHAKESGRIGIHLGGALQILFGISGKRWREHKDFKGFINENWCSPAADETPGNFMQNEGGCYW